MSEITAVDISEEALEVARENAKDNNVIIEFKESDIFSNINSKYDCIISNPPYIRYDEDGVMVWNGKRCEADPFSEDDPEYLELVEMLKEYE